MFTFVKGQPLVWRDLTFNGGVDSMGRPWSTVTWSNIVWDSLTWEALTWEAFTWSNATWESVTALSTTWEAVATLSLGALASSTPGWAPLD
jgi:hypothetical protein